MVYQDSSLDAVELPALDYVGADGTASVTIQILPELSQVKLGKLQEIPAGLSVNGVGHTSGAGLQLDFGALRKVGGPLYFQNDLGLTSLDGFGALREIGGALFIASTDVQTVALPELRAIGRMLDVELDTSLVTLDLPALDTVGSVQSSSVRLAALGKLGSADFRSIREVPMDLELSSLGTTNTSDLRLDFSSLKHIGGTLRVEGLSNLATLDGFAALETIAGAASIVADAGLSTLELPMLTTIGGTLSVSLDEDLTSIGFDGLTGVGYLDGTSVTFSSLPELTSLSVKKLPEVPSGLSFSVIGTTADGDLALDFAALAGVRGNLTVTSVKNLTTLDGFESLATVDGTLSVTSNANLPTCAATTLRDRVGAAQSTVSGNLVDACSP